MHSSSRRTGCPSICLPSTTSAAFFSESMQLWCCCSRERPGTTLPAMIIIAGQPSVSIGTRAWRSSSTNASRCAGLPAPFFKPAVVSKLIPSFLRAALARSKSAGAHLEYSPTSSMLVYPASATFARRSSKGRPLKTVQSMTDSEKGADPAADDCARATLGMAGGAAAGADAARVCADWRRSIEPPGVRRKVYAMPLVRNEPKACPPSPQSPGPRRQVYVSGVTECLTWEDESFQNLRTTKTPSADEALYESRLLRRGCEPYALATLPLLMQLVHTRRLLGAPLTIAFTFCRFTFQRRRVTLCACEMLLPNCGPLPQTSHTCAIVLLQILGVFRTAAASFPGGSTPLQHTLPRLRRPSFPGQLQNARRRTIPAACRIFSITAATTLHKIRRKPDPRARQAAMAPAPCLGADRAPRPLDQRIHIIQPDFRRSEAVHNQVKPGLLVRPVGAAEQDQGKL